MVPTVADITPMLGSNVAETRRPIKKRRQKRTQRGAAPPGCRSPAGARRPGRRRRQDSPHPEGVVGRFDLQDATRLGAMNRKCGLALCRLVAALG